MRLLEIGIRNYKSLRDVTFRPGPLSVLVGPNAAGKSNFCDALDFIEAMYEWGLQAAVMQHGGYENIRYRSMGESPSPVGFRLRARMGRDAFGGLRTDKLEYGKIDGFLVDHEINFAPTSAGFRVTRESIRICCSGETLPSGHGEELARYGQEGGRITVMEEDGLRRLLPWAAHSAPAADTLVAAPETMSLAEFGVGVGLLLRRALSGIHVFRLAAAACRGLRPSEIWIVQRPETETHVDRLTELDVDAERGWGEGHYDLAEYLDSGVLPEAVPVSPPTE